MINRQGKLEDGNDGTGRRQVWFTFTGDDESQMTSGAKPSQYAGRSADEPATFLRESKVLGWLSYPLM
jgi:hypothetical protein